MGRGLSVFLLFLLLLIAAADAFAEDQALAAVSQTTDKLVQQLGWERGDVTISKVDTRDAQIGDASIYEFDVEIEGIIVPIRFAEDITTWRYAQEIVPDADNAVVEISQFKDSVLEPFQLSGPVELWIQDGKHLRLAVPHDVDAGALNRVLLAEGATITVTGAREVSLAKPIKLPLPLVQSSGTIAESILALSQQLRDAARSLDKPLLSLRIVGPTSLIASPPPKQLDAPERLKVKRLSPGAVEIAKQQRTLISDERTTIQVDEESSTSSSSSRSKLWPLPSINSSDAKLLNLERVMRMLLGSNATKKGSFNVLRGKAIAARFVKVEFELERKLDANVTEKLWPEWATKPRVERQQFEVLAKVEGDKVIPATVRPLQSTVHTVPTSAFAWNDLSGNSTASISKSSVFYPPVSPLTL